MMSDLTLPHKDFPAPAVTERWITIAIRTLGTSVLAVAAGYFVLVLLSVYGGLPPLFA